MNEAATQDKGTLKDGKTKHQRTLLDEKLQSHRPSDRLGADDKAKWKGHGVNWMQYYARLEEISEHTPKCGCSDPKRSRLRCTSGSAGRSRA